MAKTRFQEEIIQLAEQFGLDESEQAALTDLITLSRSVIFWGSLSYLRSHFTNEAKQCRDTYLEKLESASDAVKEAIEFYWRVLNSDLSHFISPRQT